MCCRGALMALLGRLNDEPLQVPCNCNGNQPISHCSLAVEVVVTSMLIRPGLPLYHSRVTYRCGAGKFRDIGEWPRLHRCQPARKGNTGIHWRLRSVEPLMLRVCDLAPAGPCGPVGPAGPCGPAAPGCTCCPSRPYWALEARLHPSHRVIPMGPAGPAGSVALDRTC